MRPFDPIPLPPAIKDMSKAKIAIVTDGGLVPHGNPNKHQPSGGPIWGAYDIKGKADLKQGEWDVSHSGYDNRAVVQDPDRLVPVDVLREMEKNKEIGTLYNEFLSGRGGALATSRQMGREMAKRLKEAGVDAVILTSTWGTSTRSGAALVTEMEKAGIPVVQITPVTPVAKAVGSNRIVKGRAIIHPLGDPELSPTEEKDLRRQIVMEALQALRSEDKVG